MAESTELMTLNNICNRVYVIRGQQVMLDYDLAEIYGYETKYFNRQVKHNIGRFDSNDFIYCDPPYLITTGSYNDGNRGFHDWGEDEERGLYEYLDMANAQGVKFALSNVMKHKGVENKILQEWAQKYKIHYINSNYSNCSYQLKDKTAETVEVLITNY